MGAHRRNGSGLKASRFDSKTLLEFRVGGRPKPQKRHRDRRGGGKFDPSASDKRDFLTLAMEHCPEQPLEGALGLRCVFVYKPPKGMELNHPNIDPVYDPEPRMLDYAVWYARPKVPDLDNLIKFVKDALNGTFWLDDKQVVYLEATKIYGDKEETNIEILNLE